MLYMMKWNRFYNLIETVMRIDHIYTFKNAKDNNIEYTVEGYMLLIVFIVKFLRVVVNFAKKHFMAKD